MATFGANFNPSANASKVISDNLSTKDFNNPRFRNFRVSYADFSLDQKQARVEYVNTITYVTASVMYQKRGYRVSTGQYEYWRTAVIGDGPPSGNALIDITVIGEIRNSGL